MLIEVTLCKDILKENVRSMMVYKKQISDESCSGAYILVDLLEHISIYIIGVLLQNSNFKAQLRLHSYYQVYIYEWKAFQEYYCTWSTFNPLITITCGPINIV